jgi:malonyl-CoA/methylmalonyl-CoA synthetase
MHECLAVPGQGPMNLLDLFDFSLKNCGSSPAVQFRGVTLSFADLEARSNQLAQLLLQKGLKRGDRLGVCLKTSIDSIVIFLACLKLGIIMVPVSIMYRYREITEIFAYAEINAGVVAHAIPGPTELWTPGELQAKAEEMPNIRPDFFIDGDAPAVILYTSGTVGAPKGVILTHNNLMVNTINLMACWHINAADRFLLTLPLSHAHGLANGVCCWLASGCQMHLLREFDYRAAERVFLDFRPTLFFGVPTIYVRLLRIDPATARQIGSFMRLFVSGSAPLPGSVTERFRDLYGHTILDRYGTTETLMALSNPYFGERRTGSVGRPLPGVSVRLLDDNLNSVADHQIGELYLSGNLFAGYWRNDLATKGAFVDGYYRTRDLATRSTDGYYALCGRTDDMIVCGGLKIFPREIEEFLQAQPDILEAAVVGRPDELCGEVPIAYIVTKSPIDISRLVARCREQVASFKIPHEFRVLEDLPKNSMGKVLKRVLLENSLPPA